METIIINIMIITFIAITMIIAIIAVITVSFVNIIVIITFIVNDIITILIITFQLLCRLIEVNARFHAQHFYPLARACLGYDALTATMDSYFNPGKLLYLYSTYQYSAVRTGTAQHIYFMNALN